MSKVASLTIAAKSPSHKMQASQSLRDGKSLSVDVISSSDSEEETFKPRRRSSGSGYSSPERRRSTNQRQQQKVYDDERGLIHISRSGRMSAKQKSLEKELETEDPTLVSTHDEAKAASSDDGLEDCFIPREKRDNHSYYMVKEATSNEEGASIYEKRNVDPPRKSSEPAGRRIRSATGQLMDNYEKDQSFDELSSDEKNDKESTSFSSVSVLKQTYTTQANPVKTVERSKVDLELDQIRRTFRSQGMMQDNDDDDDRHPVVEEHEVLYRKPLSSIKSRFLAAASGNKMAASDSDGETGEETKKEDILPSPTSVNDLRKNWQGKGDFHTDSKVQALDEINSAEVVLARNAFREMEKKKETVSSVNRPVLHQVADAKAVMESRRHKIYGDDDETPGKTKNIKENLPSVNRLLNHKVKDPKEIMEIRRYQTYGDHNDDDDDQNEKENLPLINRLVSRKCEDPKMIMERRRHQTYGDRDYNDDQVDGTVTHPCKDELASAEIDSAQIKAARLEYERLEEEKKQKKTFIKRPSMKLIKQDQVNATMDEHRRKVSGEEWAIEHARKYSNGFHDGDTLDNIANGNNDA